MLFTGETFESKSQLSPDDIDMNNHVHNSKYLDYLLMARYDQMRKDYKVPMKVFLVSIANGRPARIPKDIIQKYTV